MTVQTENQPGQQTQPPAQQSGQQLGQQAQPPAVPGQQAQQPGQQQTQQPPAQQRPDRDGYYTHSDGQRRGFPEGRPWQEMTLQEQVAYWQNSSRRHENRAQRNTPDHIAELERKASEYDALTAASQTDVQRTEERVRNEMSAQFAQREVEWAIRAAVGPRLTEEQLAAHLGPLNRSWFLTDGQVDTAKVNQYAASLQPTGHGTAGAGFNGYGYQPGARPSGRDAGIAEAEKRFPQRQN